MSVLMILSIIVGTLFVIFIGLVAGAILAAIVYFVKFVLLKWRV